MELTQEISEQQFADSSLLESHIEEEVAQTTQESNSSGATIDELPDFLPAAVGQQSSKKLISSLRGPSSSQTSLLSSSLAKLQFGELGLKSDKNDPTSEQHAAVHYWVGTPQAGGVQGERFEIQIDTLLNEVATVMEPVALAVDPELEQSSVKKSGADRRGFPRRESDSVVSLYFLKPDEWVNEQKRDWLLHSTKTKGQLIDLSMSGIAFELDCKIAAERRVLLRLTNQTLQQKLDTDAIVIRSEPTTENRWQIFCRFEKHLSLEEIHSFSKHVQSQQFI